MADGLINTCPSCGAEEALDNLLARMLDDDQVRRLIADVLTYSLPVGGLVVSYLRLHKPARQRLRMQRVALVLGELVPDIRRGAITRKGREWQAPVEAWRAAFAAVFEARDKGVLSLPLEGNAYLYEVVLRQADKAEAGAEREREQSQRGRSHTGGTQSVADVMQVLQAAPAAAPTAPVLSPPALPTGPGLYARRLLAQGALKRAQTETSPEGDA
jgi:hypothetical protein